MNIYSETHQKLMIKNNRMKKCDLPFYTKETNRSNLNSVFYIGWQV